MKASRLWTLLAALLATLSGCELVKAPVVELEAVRLRGIGLRGATIIAELAIYNPNRFAIESDSVTFEFAARDPRNPRMWSPVTSGTNTQRVRIEKEQRSIVEIPIEFAYSRLGMPIRSILERGTLDYRIRGEVYVRKPLRKGVPFNREGAVSVGGGR